MNRELVTRKMRAVLRFGGKILRGEPVLGILQHKQAWDAQFERGTWEFLLANQPNTQIIAEYCLARSKELGRPVAVCDVGCGNGGLRKALLQAGCPVARYTGIDLSVAALEQARKVDETGIYIAHDLGKGFPGTPPHDIYIMNEVLYYLPSPKRFLRQIRACMPAGSVAVFSMYRSWRGSLIRAFIATERKAWSKSQTVHNDTSTQAWRLTFLCFEESEAPSSSAAR